MRLVKLALLSAFFPFLLVTAFSLFIPSKIRISKAVNIGQNKKELLKLVNEESRWKWWHPAFMNDSFRKAVPLKVIPVSGNDSEIVKKVQQGDRLPVLNGWKIHGSGHSDSLALQWYMDFELRWYPWQKFGSLFYEGTYGRIMQEGLQNLKKQAETGGTLDHR